MPTHEVKCYEEKPSQQSPEALPCARQLARPVRGSLQRLMHPAAAAAAVRMPALARRKGSSREPVDAQPMVHRCYPPAGRTVAQVCSCEPYTALHWHGRTTEATRQQAVLRHAATSCLRCCVACVVVALATRQEQTRCSSRFLARGCLPFQAMLHTRAGASTFSFSAPQIPATEPPRVWQAECQLFLAWEWTTDAQR